MHQAAGHYDPTPCTKAAGREYRFFRARPLRTGNERGCVEPPVLERSPQLVTAGRNVRRWCLHTAVRPAFLHSVPYHPEHREGSPSTSSHPHSIPPPSPLHLATIQPLSRHHPSSSPPTPILSPPYPFFATPRFCTLLIFNYFQLCLGENSPKQNHNLHTNNHLQKRPVSKYKISRAGPGTTADDPRGDRKRLVWTGQDLAPPPDIASGGYGRCPSESWGSQADARCRQARWLPRREKVGD